MAPQKYYSDTGYDLSQLCAHNHSRVTLYSHSNSNETWYDQLYSPSGRQIQRNEYM